MHMRAQSSIHFPLGKPGNILRGALGLAFRSIACDPACLEAASCPYGTSCAYLRVFDPVPPPGAPSGLADPPRPFVFRARHLSGAVLRPGQEFHFDVHLFDRDRSIAAYFIAAFTDIAATGLGPQRGHAELLRVSALDEQQGQHAELYVQNALTNADVTPVEISLEPGLRASTLRVEFLSPTELRKDQTTDSPPDFGFLFARVRDRVSNLRAFYGAGPLPVDFVSLGRKARDIGLVRSSIRSIHTMRTSRRTGQTHPIGGFLGTAEFEGVLGEFLPYFLAAKWTGVGRHAVWGNGEIAVEWT